MSPAKPDPRRCALEVLTQVHAEDAYANLALPRALADSGLDERDRAFTTELVYGSLRRQGELDTIIRHAAKREVSTLDPLTLDILRLGVYQLLHLRVPDHAAVDQSVRLARHAGVHRATGFINAVLRKVSQQTSEHWASVVEADTGCIASHPEWIAREIESALALGENPEPLHEALGAHNNAPLVTLACLPGLSERGVDDTHTPWSPLGIVLQGGNPGADHRIGEGSARVQDEGSQLAALLLTRWRALGPDDTILDMCAGPGGKTAVLAAEALVAGAHVEAVEKVPHRVGLVTDSTRAIAAIDPHVLTVRQGDAREVSGAYSHVLLDAPCSGLGALRRRPEARWRKSPDQLHDLTVLQTELLEAGLDVLRPGGVLAYVTCSPVIAETSDVVNRVLETRPGCDVVDTPAVLDRVAQKPVPGAARGTAVQLWTHRHGTDAMFIQLIRRRDDD